MRYAKHYYGASASIEVSCSCGEKASRDWGDEIQSSSMDELV